MLETIKRARLASDLGLVDDEGKLSERLIAQFMRDALTRWGMCPKRALHKHARDQLRACDVPTDIVPRVLNRLVALGECTEVAVGYEAYVLPGEPRWIASSEGLAVLLGPVVAPAETPRMLTPDPSDIVVRIQVESEEQAATLMAHRARQVSLAEWLHPLGYLRHAVQRSGEAIRCDQVNLATFWERLVAAISLEGLQIAPDAEVRAVVGEPGGFFGQHAAATLEGRWQTDIPDGVWCAYRRGHGDGHWLPILISVDGDDRRALDLFDDDEWRWALLARSRAVGPEEVVQHSGDVVQVTWHLPAQLWAALDIVGIPTGSWRWRVAADGPDLWSLLK